MRSPVFSGSPMGSAHNSDAENDPRTPGALKNKFNVCSHRKMNVFISIRYASANTLISLCTPSNGAQNSTQVRIRFSHACTTLRCCYLVIDLADIRRCRSMVTLVKICLAMKNLFFFHPVQME
jgi:hypothetical protein